MLNLILNFALVIILGILLLLNLLKLYVPIVYFQAVSIVAIVPVIIAAYKSIKQREVSVDFLAAVALIFAYIAQEWESAVFINLMLSSARIFDIWTTRKSDHLVKSLLKYRPEKVKVKVDDHTIIKNVEDIIPGDILIIGGGERIAVDGVIISGQASIDEATLTGESFPIAKRVGDKVFSSTLNTSGSILVRTEKAANESTLAKIITMVEKSSLKKSKTVKMVNKFAKWYIVATFIGAITIYLITKDMNFVLAILLVVCADDIAVSIPLAFTVAVSTAAKGGILIKSSDVLERLSKIDVFITDKTGTLTSSKPKIVKIETFGDITQKELLKYLLAAEINSSHPVAAPIVEYAKIQNSKVPAITDFKETPGEGIEVLYNNKNVVSGKLEFLKTKHVKIGPPELKIIEQYSKDGYSLVSIGIDKKIKGVVVFEDEIRPSAKSAIRKTKELGSKLWIMLTGDNKVVAKKISDQAGIDIFEANVSPEGKLRYVEDYQTKNKKDTVAMIGDGVNDAAALALADVSFAMGVVGSDAAINAADVALMDDSLDKIPKAMEIGKRTRGVSYTNIAIWGLTNIVGLVLVFSHVLSPTGAATYNFLTDFLPIFNALSIAWNKKI